MITSFKMFRESNEKYKKLKNIFLLLQLTISNFKKSFDKKTMISRMKKSHIYFEQIPKLEREYNSLIGSNFRTLEVDKTFSLNYRSL